MSAAASDPASHPATLYAHQVVRGEVVAGALVRAACQRHLDDLAASEDPAYPYEFDPDAADHVLDFCALCCHFEGEWAGQPFEPEPWQVFIFSSVFGWLRRSNRTRRFRHAFVMIARKNGKTFLAAVAGLYVMLLDAESGCQVINFANALDQARILFRAAEEMRRRSPAIARRVGAVKDNLHVTETASFWRPLANDATVWDGLNAQLGLGDEIHEHDGKTYEVVESSMGARRQPLMLSITTAGFEQGGFGGQLYDYMRDVVDPQTSVTNDEAFAFIAQLDEKDDPFDETVWAKANPNLGISKKLDYMRGMARKAADMPRARNNFLTKDLNVWTAQKTRWIPMEEWDACPGVLDVQALDGLPCIGGLDLSTNTDLTALVLVFWTLNPIPVLPFFWLPEDNITARVKGDKVPYDVWRDEGYIELTPGNVIDYAFIEKRVLSLARRFRLVELAYDPHNATQTALRLQDEGLLVMAVAQNHANLNEPSRHLESLILGRQLHHGAHPILRWNAANAAVKRNAHGEIKPLKDERKKRIDGIAALVTALARVLRQPKTAGGALDALEIHVPPSSRKRDVLELFS